MSITLGRRSLDRLEGVHPDLVRVVKRAAADSNLDFTVLEGVRSREQMMINYGKGRGAKECIAAGVDPKYARPQERTVTWLKNPFMSNHRVHEDGFGHAVDLAPYPIDWQDLPRFHALAAVMKQAAAKEKVAISAGADWAKADFPHFELA